ARELIGVTTAFHDEVPGHQTHRLAERDAQPELVVLAHRERLVETAELLVEAASKDHRRGAHQTAVETARKEALFLAVPCAWVAMTAAVEPALAGLRDAMARMRAEPGALHRELVWQPEIVRIEKGDPGTVDGGRTGVASGGDPRRRLAQHARSR